MGFLNRLKNVFFRDNNDNELNAFYEEERQIPFQEIGEPEIGESLDFPEHEIVSFSGEVLDTTSRISIEKFKHNLEVLIKRAKEVGKVDKFMIIREDNFFPADWEWRVLSKYTNLERQCTCLSYELKKAFALEQSGIAPYMQINGVKVPNVSHEQIMQALSQVDKMYGSVLLPSRFRSTKHFTVNTALGATGDYNNVSTERDYIIIDGIDNFLESGYAYSVSYHDAYLDISHESLPISPEAVVLINDENYERIMSDEKIADEISQRKVVRFKGDEDIAINMILTEMGVLPSRVGALYADYDKEICDILDQSIRHLAEENDLFFDKSHAGDLTPNGGHFSNYYDEKNRDYEKALQEFVSFLRQRFPDQKEIFPEDLVLTEITCGEIIEKLGISTVYDAINEYNSLVSCRMTRTLDEYKNDRRNITPEVHRNFVETIELINDFYKCEINYGSYETRVQIEDAIKGFIQGESVREQLEAAKSVWKLLPDKIKSAVGEKTITMEEVVSNAIRRGVSTEHITRCDNVEYRAIQGQQVEDITIDE